jgi:hypothetical protein
MASPVKSQRCPVVNGPAPGIKAPAAESSDPHLGLLLAVILVATLDQFASLLGVAPGEPVRLMIF